MSDKDIYLCRCENLTLADLHRLMDEGYIHMEEIKRMSRCTMGPCQGRTCRDIIAKEIAKRRNIDVTAVEVPTFRAPTKPVKLGVLAAGAEDA